MKISWMRTLCSEKDKNWLYLGFLQYHDRARHRTGSRQSPLRFHLFSLRILPCQWLARIRPWLSRSEFLCLLNLLCFASHLRQQTHQGIHLLLFLVHFEVLIPWGTSALIIKYSNQFSMHFSRSRIHSVDQVWLRKGCNRMLYVRLVIKIMWR